VASATTRGDVGSAWPGMPSDRSATTGAAGAARRSIGSAVPTPAPRSRSRSWQAEWTTCGRRRCRQVLRSVPPTVWAVIALLGLFPGVLPGALALGLYTAGILGRLVAEAWESVDTRPRDAIRAVGTPGWVAAIAAVVPPSSHQLVTYTLYRFEICIRETAVVGVVGAAGLGYLVAENLAAFRWPAVTTLLLASFALSVGSEVVGRMVRRGLRA